MENTKYENIEKLKNELQESLAKGFISDVKRYFENVGRDSYIFFSKRLIVFYSGTVLLFLINFEALAKICGEGTLLWSSILALVAIIIESYVYFINIAKNKVSVIINDIADIFEEYESDIPNNEVSVFIDKVMIEIENSSLTKDLIKSISKNLSTNNKKVNNDLKFVLETLNSEEKLEKSKTFSLIEYYKERDINIESENKDKSSSDHKELFKRLGNSLLSVILFALSILIFICSIFHAKYSVMFSWIM